jgi:Streptomyces sporulation and cell division protein, SsgA
MASRYITSGHTAQAVNCMPGNSAVPVPMRVSLSWDREDPLAVCLEVGTGAPNSRTWLIARSMLYDALAGRQGARVGKGEVRLQATAKTIDVTWPRNPMVVLRLDRPKTAEWLNQTLKVMGDLEAGTSYDWGHIAGRILGDA